MFESILIGIIQGLTEFLPVSSSGHLVLAQHFLHTGNNENLSFEVFLHLGSLMAVFIYFRRDILTLIKSWFKWSDSSLAGERKTTLWLLIATVVTGVVGFGMESVFEQLFGSPLIVAIMLSITGIILFISDKMKGKQLTMPEMGWKKSLIVGIGQSIAITPGVSRSGTTIAFALFTGLERAQAARFSFLLSIPAILGANLKEFSSILALDHALLINYCAGFVAAGLSGYLVIGLLLKIIAKAQLKWFSFYCWTVSVVSVVLILSGF